MYIKKIHIQNFGKFEDYELDLTDGFNVIFGRNEDGKSTIMDFLMMMFYGYNGKKQDIRENPRKRYRPWNGKDMRGQIIFESGDREYRLERTFQATNKSDDVQLYNNLTGAAIKINKDPGEYIFNLGGDAFERTVFITAGNTIMTTTGNRDEITQKLMNLVTTGDEDTSYEVTKARLNNAKYALRSKSGRKGALADSESRVQELKSALSEAIDDEKKKGDYKRELNIRSATIRYLEDQDRDLNEKLSQYKDMNSLRQKKSLLNNIENISSTRNQVAELTQELTTDNGVLGQKFVDEVEDELQAAYNNDQWIQQSQEKIKSKRSKLDDVEEDLKKYLLVPEGLVSDLKTKKAEMDENNSRLVTIGAALKTYQENAGTLVKIEKIKNEIKELNDSLIQLRPALEKATNEKAVLETDRAGFTEKIQEIEKRIERNQNKEPLLTAQKINYDERIARANKEYENSKKEKEEGMKAYTQLLNVEGKGKSQLMAAGVLGAIALVLLVYSLVSNNQSLILISAVGIVLAILLFLMYTKAKKNKTVASTEATAKVEQIKNDLKQLNEEYTNSIQEMEGSKSSLIHDLETIKEEILKDRGTINGLQDRKTGLEQNLNTATALFDQLIDRKSELDKGLELKAELLRNEEERAQKIELISPEELSEREKEKEELTTQSLDIKNELQEKLNQYGCADIFELSQYELARLSLLDDQNDYQTSWEKETKRLNELQGKKEQAISSLKERLSVLNFSDGTEEIPTLIKSLKDKVGKLNDLKIKLTTEERSLSEDDKSADLDFLKAEINELSLKLDNAESISEEASEINRKIDDIIKQQKDIKKDISDEIEEKVRLESTAKEQFRGKLNVSQVQDQLKQEELVQNELKSQLSNLELAIEYLDDSFQEIQKDFSPKINQNTSENFSYITGGKYDYVKVDKDYNITIEDKESRRLKEWGYLSAGTIDQVYLSLRLAVSAFLADKDNPLPLLMDDVFTQYDGERAENALDCIHALVSKQEKMPQVLLFTCHDTLIDWAEHKGLHTMSIRQEA